MTRKHFTTVAKILAAYDGEADAETVRKVAGDLADYFAEDNPNFDRQRFLDAAGVL